MPGSTGEPQPNAIWMLLALAGVVGVGVLVLVFWQQRSSPPGDTASPLLGNDAPAALFASPAAGAFDDPVGTPTAAAPATAALVVVYITGGVMQPDVYQLPADARVKDVVVAAGGLSADAASEQINLAARIYDEQHIHVPRQGEQPPAQTGDTPGADGQDAAPSPASAGAAPVTTDNAPAAPVEAGANEQADSPPGQPVNINTASAAELATLNGIGPALAQNIIDYRTANGSFRTLEELQDVRGIGPVLFANIRASITLDGP